MFNVPVNNFSVMSGRSHRFLGFLPVLLGVNVSCLRTQHGDPCGIVPRTSRFGVRRSATRPPRSLVQNDDNRIPFKNHTYIMYISRYTDIILWLKIAHYNLGGFISFLFWYMYKCSHKQVALHVSFRLTVVKIYLLAILAPSLFYS